MTSTPPRTAFVLAGGGSLGAVEVGMLHALTEHGLKPDFALRAWREVILGSGLAFGRGAPLC